MRLTVFPIVLAFAVPGHSQEISVPSVATASPGGYANPLQLDTDRYKRANSKTRRSFAPFGLCNGKPLSKAKRAALESAYATRAKTNERQASRWLRTQCGPNEAWTISRAVQRRGVVR